MIPVDYDLMATSAAYVLQVLVPDLETRRKATVEVAGQAGQSVELSRRTFTLTKAEIEVKAATK